MLLIDENLSYKLVAVLQEDFPGARAVVQVLGEGAEDKEIWAYAQTHELAVLTKDKDFVDHWRRKGPPPKVVLLDIGNCRWTTVQGRIVANRDRIIRFLRLDPGGLLVI